METKLDAIKFAVNEKANQASKLMDQYSNNNKAKFDFYYGQYLAFNEIYSLLSHV